MEKAKSDEHAGCPVRDFDEKLDAIILEAIIKEDL
jgi:hypothetical protein